MLPLASLRITQVGPAIFAAPSSANYNEQEAQAQQKQNASTHHIPHGTRSKHISPLGITLVWDAAHGNRPLHDHPLQNSLHHKRDVSDEQGSVIDSPHHHQNEQEIFQSSHQQYVTRNRSHCTRNATNGDSQSVHDAQYSGNAHLQAHYQQNAGGSVLNQNFTSHHTHYDPHLINNACHSLVKSHGPGCLARGNLHLASCHCISHFWFHGEHVAPPNFEGTDQSNCEVTLSLEGTFIQTSEHQVLCMLGCAVRPTPLSHPSLSPLSSQNRHGKLHIKPQCTVHGCKEIIEYNEAPIFTATDCNISLDVVYPINLTKQSFSSHGVISSLRGHDDPLYFRPFSVSAVYFSTPSRYRYASQQDSADCELEGDSRWNVHPLHCDDLRQVLDELHLSLSYEDEAPILPSTLCRIGPFTSHIPNMTISNTAQIHEFACSSYGSVLRVRFFLTASLAGHSHKSKHTEFFLKSAAELTLSVEGILNKTSGKLCGNACSLKPSHLNQPAYASQGDDYDCKIGVYLDVNSQISLSNRWMVEGRLVYQGDVSNEMFFPPLKLQTNWPSSYDKERVIPYPINYQYTRIEEVYEILPLDEEHVDGYVYPSSVGYEQYCADTAKKLTFEAMGCVASGRNQLHLQLDVIAVESCVLLEVQTKANDSTSSGRDLQSQHTRIAVEMWIGGAHVAAEGLYDTGSRLMALAACTYADFAFAERSPDMLFGGESDCSISIIVQFPPSSLTWFKERVWKVSIASTRHVSDKLFFEPLDILDRQLNTPAETKRLHRRLEGGLRLLVSSGTLYCCISQLALGRKVTDIYIPISLTMITFQGAGMAIPMIVQYLATFKGNGFDFLALSNQDSSVELMGALTNIIRCLSCLTLICLFVCIIRARLRKAEGRFTRMEASVAKVCILLHFGTFAVFTIAGAWDTAGSHGLLLSKSFWIFYATRASQWKRDLEVYGSFLQDLFLLPQVMQNHLCREKTIMRPLHPKFYGGITFLQVVMHAYHFHKCKFRKERLNWNFLVECILTIIALLLVVCVLAQRKSDDKNTKKKYHMLSSI
ncbi:hypothetical protein L7F22_030882 [Adiantum nelumboides]|nr:hypothetical protein [Adiantum nelumboides]